MSYDFNNHKFVDIDENINDVEFPFIDIYKGKPMSEIVQEKNVVFNIYYNSQIVENDIHEVMQKVSSSKENRLGWLIPVHALFSKEHSYCENVHFAYYAFLAYSVLLRNEEIINKLKTNNSLQKTLDDLYDNNDSVIFICEDISRISFNSMDALNPDLYKYGYFKKKCDCTREIIKHKVLYLKSISAFFYKNENSHIKKYITDLFDKLFFENNPRMKFLALYQIFEIAMDDLLIDLMSDKIENIKNGSLSLRSINSIFNQQSEFTRISEILRVCHLDFNEYTILNTLCKDFLEKKGYNINNIKEFPDSIYQFRNSLVHRLRWFIEDDQEINSVNQNFELLIFDILNNYKKDAASVH